MSTLAVAGVVVVVLFVSLLAWFVMTYNTLVRFRNQVQNSWSQVEVQLKRRYDLIPNLVQTVKGYATHERGALQAVTDARVNALSAQGPEAQAASGGELTGALKGLFAVAESYPDLKADKEFLTLQQQLDDTENHISYARQYYNDAVFSLNTKVNTIPSALVASTCHFRPAQFFKAGAEEEGPVAVQF